METISLPKYLSPTSPIHSPRTSPPTGLMTSIVNRIRHGSFDEPLPESEKVHFSVLDFGGQEVFQSTHRFFLTAGALYLVMFDLSDTRTFNSVEYPKPVVDINVH